MKTGHYKSLAFALIAIGLLSACDRTSRLPEFELRGPTMGTTFSAKIIDALDDSTREMLGAEIVDRLESIEQVMSTYREQSELSRFNASESIEWADVSAELCHAIEASLAVSHMTNGAFDITVGPLVNLWGFGPGEAVSVPPSQEILDAAMSRVGFDRLATRCETPAVRKDNPDIYLDLSGWAKGYAADELAELLDRNGITDYLVEVGGELRARGMNVERRKWAVAIEQPIDYDRRPQTVLRLTDFGVATSGDYRNFFEHDSNRYSHTIDGRTGRPVTHALSAVTVVNRSAAFADAMAT
ncbi:MAG: FAD:protein FMN transferase, partial [Betaproteobacteria bacterium]|nr:FAD:protein FMN transferase [Betaproteobacteria bacterium]